MATQEIQAPRLGEPGEQCAACGAPLATDQRYCLNCGERRAEPRLPFLELFGADARAAEVPPTPPVATATPGATPAPKGRPDWLVAALFGGGGLALLLVGALIGSAVNDPQITVPQAKAPVVNVSSPAAAAAPAAATATAVEFTSDWPGDDGWTIQLQVLAKDGNDAAAVAAAKTSAQGQGATEVGALDSDEYASLDPGNYVIYNGVYTSKKDAQAALKGLKASFPDAKVVEVSASGSSDASASSADTAAPDTGNADKASKSELKDLENASGDDYVKQSKKLKDTTATEGAPPKKDNKPAGGGEEGETIG